MNKNHWILPGPNGRHNKLGLLHSPKNGNFMIYYNDKILEVDREVFESKSYKFFIDEEFCEIKVIERRNGTFGYEFQFDYKAKTKGNAIRKKTERKWAFQSVSFFIIFFLGLVVASFVFIYFRSGFLERQLAKNGEFSEVTLRVTHVHGQKKTFYHYKTKENESYSSKPTPISKTPTTPHGLPIGNMDTYRIIYATNNIFNHKIDYNQPTEATVNKLIKRVYDFHIQHHQGRIQQELYCEVLAAYEIAGLEGLAQIYHQKKTIKESAKYNNETYLNLIRDTPFENATSICWEDQNN